MVIPAPPVRRAPATALLIKWADMAARSRLEAATRPWRLSAGQMLVLTTLDQIGEATPAALSRAVHLTPQAMTTLLKPLTERGLIVRREDATHRRRVVLSMSPAGVAQLQEVRAVTPGVDAAITAALSPEELDQFRDMLARVAGLAER